MKEFDEFEILIDELAEFEDYMCENKEKVYDFQRFWNMNFWAFSNYKQLVSYVSDKETVKDYLNKYSYSVNEQVEKKIDARPEMIEEFNLGLEETIQWINNQMIVYMCTILEIAINDFFKCLFIEKPYMVLNLNNYTGRVIDIGFSYQELLKCDSKEEYIIEMARNTAKKCNSGKIDKILESISKMTGLKWESDYREVLKDLSDKRNKIVHENMHVKLSAYELEYLYNGLEKSLILLGKKLREMNIVVKDNGGFLDEEPFYMVNENCE